jgi:hypothetical protein
MLRLFLLPSVILYSQVKLHNDLYCSSVKPLSIPDILSTNTRCPTSTKAVTPDGVCATRYSLFLTSRGNPIIILITPFSQIITTQYSCDRSQRPDQLWKIYIYYKPKGRLFQQFYTILISLF